MPTPDCITIYKAYKFRLYPTVRQEGDFSFHFGAVRHAYNLCLFARERHYKRTGKTLTYNACSKALTEYKQIPGNEWMQQAYSQSLQQSMMDLDKAYQNFFSKKSRYPRRKKDGKDSMRFVLSRGIRIKDGRIRIPKVGMVRLVQHNKIEGVPKSMTVSKTKSGKFFVSISVELSVPVPRYEGGEIGIDLGLKSFAVLSNGRVVNSPRHLRKSEKRLAQLQRSLSRKRKGSSNRNKARLLVARQHERIANRRKDFLHKLSYQLASDNSHIGIEDLHVKGMVKNHSLAKSISDSGWAEFVRQLEYKGQWYGCEIVKVDRWFPSSKTCGDCGAVNSALQLSDRKWICEECGIVHDRDLNAAQNILKESRARTARIDGRGDMSSGSRHTQPGNPIAPRAPAASG